jgi:hypothetical protein
MRNLLKSVVAIVVGLSCASWASAATISSGFLVTDSQVVATDGWQNSGGGFKISWLITDDGIAGFPIRYQYTISNASDGDLSKNLSHLILQVSANFSANDIANVVGVTMDSGAPKTYVADGSNPDMPGSLYGIKFTPPTGTRANFTFSFDSTRAPMDGHFYSKDGQDSGVWVTAWNSAFDGSGSAYLKVPDTFSPGPTPIPLPATVWMGALGLIGVGLMKYRRLARA